MDCLRRCSLGLRSSRLRIEGLPRELLAGVDHLLQRSFPSDWRGIRSFCGRFSDNRCVAGGLDRRTVSAWRPGEVVYDRRCGPGRGLAGQSILPLQFPCFAFGTVWIRGVFRWHRLSFPAFGRRGLHGRWSPGSEPLSFLTLGQSLWRLFLAFWLRRFGRCCGQANVVNHLHGQLFRVMSLDLRQSSNERSVCDFFGKSRSIGSGVFCSFVACRIVALELVSETLQDRVGEHLWRTLSCEHLQLWPLYRLDSDEPGWRIERTCRILSLSSLFLLVDTVVT